MCVPQYQTLWYTTRAIEGSIPVETLSSQTIDCNYKTVYHEYDIDIVYSANRFYIDSYTLCYIFQKTHGVKISNTNNILFRSAIRKNVEYFITMIYCDENVK